MHDAKLLGRRSRRSGGAERTAHERELAIAYQQDPAERPHVVEALTPLAHSTLRRYKHVREPREDLEQVAIVGLLKALQGFDAEQYTSFAAYAYPTIRGELMRHFRDTGWALHVPRGTKQLTVAIARLERDAGARLPDDDLAEQLGVDVPEVHSARRARSAMVTESTASGDADPAGDAGIDDAGYGRAEDRVFVDALLRDLPDDARILIRLRYDAGLTQRRIGELLGISQMQVCRRLRQTMGELSERAAADA